MTGSNRRHLSWRGSSSSRRKGGFWVAGAGMSGYHHVQAIIVSIDQYAESAVGNRDFFFEPAVWDWLESQRQPSLTERELLRRWQRKRFSTSAPPVPSFDGCLTIIRNQKSELNFCEAPLRRSSRQPGVVAPEGHPNRRGKSFVPHRLLERRIFQGPQSAKKSRDTRPVP